MFAPFYMVYLEATRRCNFACPACMTKRPGCGERELSFEEIVERVLRPFAALPNSPVLAKQVNFSGGEFLLREDAFDLLAEAHRLGLRVRVTSNGSTLTGGALERLKAVLGANLTILLGVNGVDDVNLATRCVPASFTFDLIERLRRQGINTQVIVTVSTLNADRLPATIERIKALRLPYNRAPFIPRNSDRHDLIVDAETMRTKVHPVFRSCVNGYVSFTPFFLPPEEYAAVSGQDENRYPLATNPTVGCFCGSWIAINAEGDVAPCPLLLDVVSGGSVRQSGLPEILGDSPLFQAMLGRHALTGQCGACKYKFTCGGCRAVAYYKTGDLYASDPTCFIDRLSPRELRALEQETTVNFRRYATAARAAGMCQL